MNKFLFILFFIFSSLILSAQANFANAAANPTTLLVDNFGGTVLSFIPCMCNGGFIIAIQDFKTMLPVMLMVQPFISRINLNYSFLPGNSVLGSFHPAPTPCLNGIPPLFCIPTATAQGIIVSMPLAGVGTSLLPSKVAPI